MGALRGPPPAPLAHQGQLQGWGGERTVRNPKNRGGTPKMGRETQKWSPKINGKRNLKMGNPKNGERISKMGENLENRGKP